MLAARSAATTSLSMWIILLLGTAVWARRQRDGPDYGDEDSGDDDGESWSENVARARCASRCLSLHSVGALSTPLEVRTRRA